MTLNNDQEIVLNTLIGMGHDKIMQDKAADVERYKNIQENVCFAFQIPDNLQEFVSLEEPHYEYGTTYTWLRIPGLLPIKLSYGERDYHGGYYTSGCTVMLGDEPHHYVSLTEALAVAKDLADQPIPPAAMKIDEDTINAAYDELERTTRVAHQSQPDWQWSVEIAEQKVRRLSAILNFRTKTLLMDRYQNQDA